ncbi:MAG: Rieske 2Fe-2S domain-containing protein, partial [Proteobacteria bacterium]|nr:Rieske 2Fe-2S domain-containing protein [Pseudomonadota bacterium]
MSNISNDEIRGLVQPSRVHRRVYADADVFDLEMERIFERTWVYAAHESEIGKAGDFVRARIGRREVIIVRGDDAGVRGFYNRCPHRGSMICNVHQGHVATFDCPYHGWSFARDGGLLGVPLPTGYPAQFDVDDPRNSLEPVAQIDSYRGFIFINLSAGGPALADYLAPVRDS